MRKLLLVSLGVLICSTTLGGGRETLLKQIDRPTVSDVIQSFRGDLSARNPFKPCFTDSFLDVVKTAGPQIIADLEYAYPGSVWAPLGRDSSLVGDVLEAYSLHFGQEGRVVRLNASGGSFAQDVHYLGLLQAAGLVGPKGEIEQNFVIVDPTSWGTHSQIRRLIASVYGPLSSGERKALLGKVDAMDLGKGGGISVSTQASVFLNNRTFGSDGAPSAIFSTSGSLSYPSGGCGAEMAWHGPFLPFNRSGDFWIAPPGGAYSAEVREHILWRMYELNALMDSPEFLDSADQQAKVRLNFNLSEEIAKNFASQGAAVALAEDGPELVQGLKDLVIAANLAKEASKRGPIGQIRSLSQRLYAIANLDLDLKLLKEVAGLLSPSDQETLYVETVGASSDLERTLQLLEQAPKHFLDKNLTLYTDLVLSQKPSVEQINRLSFLAQGNSVLQEQIVAKSLKSLSTYEEYQALRKPNKLFKSRDYKNSLRQFKKSHPRSQPKTSRGFFQRNKKGVANEVL